MGKFIQQALMPDNNLGRVLAEARGHKHLSLSQVANRLGVAQRYLEALETGNASMLPPGSYGKFFVRRYAEFLGLDALPLLQVYQSSVGPITLAMPQKQHSELKPVHPLRRLLFAAGIVLVVGYLAAGAWYAFLPPKLDLVSPAADSVTEIATVMLVGSTEVGAEVSINGTLAAVNEHGRFMANVPLQPGLNQITVLAHTAFSRPVRLVRSIYYTPPPVSAVTEEPSIPKR